MTLRDTLQQASGLNLSEAIVERAVRRRMEQCAIDDPAQYRRTLSAQEVNALIELVVVPESWMFRDPDAFDAATAVVRRRLAAGRDAVRILSIPCAGGEEPYSMAMALIDAGVKPQAYRIDAIDLSSVAIGRARAGRYTRNAFRGRALGFRNRFFTAVGDDYQLDDTVRAQVNFSQGNLLAFDVSAATGRYDIIFCRNLLIYFDDPTTTAAIANLRTLLADDGVLFAGYAEVPSFCRNGFSALRVPGAFGLEKSSARTPTPPAPASRPRRILATAPVSPPRPKPAPAPIKQPAPAASPDLLALARRQADQGAYEAASATCHAALAADSGLADAYFILGLVSASAHKNEAAGEFWRRCVYLQPNHYDALCHLSLLADESGDKRQAATLRQRAARVFERAKATS